MSKTVFEATMVPRCQVSVPGRAPRRADERALAAQLAPWPRQLWHESSRLPPILQGNIPLFQQPGEPLSLSCMFLVPWLHCALLRPSHAVPV